MQVDLRFFLDPETGAPHIYNHDVCEEEVEEVLADPGEVRKGREDSWVAIGATAEGRILRVIYSPDPDPKSVFVITAYEQGEAAGRLPAPAAPKEKMMKAKVKNQFPPGWDEDRVRRVLEHYQNQSEEEAVAEDEASFEATAGTLMTIPPPLVPEVRQLITRYEQERKAS